MAALKRLSTCSGGNMDWRDPRLRELWKQKNIPVVFRRSSPDPLLLRLPYATDNFEWIRGDRRHKPKWNSQFSAWEVPVAWFDEITAKVLRRFGKAYVIQLYKKHQKCAPACWNAKGLHCECSCMGARHGTGHPQGRWHEVSDTFAFSWGPKQYACRLLSSLSGQ
ncbi:hypothetical protein SAMN04487951_110114 [Vreelandella arcis]|uniref:Uncharacterized protein n=1 Tax=Vreelandella arcis TaxID=416873 RepID=A0A1H0FQP3_9GAMM|nr:hypothetical protein SAMN04487951_110114 [Halomonas arcis]